MSPPPLLDLQALAQPLGRCPKTVRHDMRRNPWAAPPSLQVLGTQQLSQREADVAGWLEQLAAPKESRHG